MTPKVELEDLVTTADIGRRLGISRQAAAKLSTDDTFPDPIGKLGNYRVWRWRPVEKWALQRNTRARQPVLTAVSTDGKLLFTTDDAVPGVIHVHKLNRDGAIGERVGSAIAWAGTPIIELRPHESGVTVVGGRYEGEITRNTKRNWTLSSARERTGG
jgi:hypothetical protein